MIINPSDVAKELFEDLNNNFNSFGIIPKGDFIAHADRIISLSEFDNEKGIEDNAVSIANRLYDELDKSLNLPNWVDIIAKDIFIPVACTLIKAFIEHKLFFEKKD